MNKSIQISILLVLSLILVAQFAYMPIALSILFLINIIGLSLFYRKQNKHEISDFPKYLRILMMVFLIFLSLAIGISRIYLRVHFPSDVIAGFALGYSWLFMVLFIFKKWFPLK